MSDTQTHHTRSGPAALAGEGRALGGALLAAICAVLGFAIRYGFIEPVAYGAACEEAVPWWCPLRTGLIVFTEIGGFGWLALGASAAALVALTLRLARPAGALAIVALIAGGLGMILYNATASVPATILAVLVLIGTRRIVAR